MFDYYTKYIQISNKLAELGPGGPYSDEGRKMQDDLEYFYSKMTSIEKQKANFMVRKIALDKEIEKSVQLPKE